MTTTANAVTAPLAVIFTVNDGLIGRALQGLSDDELWRRPSEGSNPMMWLLGHIVHTRAGALRLLGDEYRTGWGERFRRGTALADRASYPPLSEIERVRADVTQRFHARLLAAPPERLAAPATLQLPAAKTVIDEIAFLGLHESYHVGQLAYIRKLFGYSSIAG
jgi:uncharacterized damage-inducible protein DinB